MHFAFDNQALRGRTWKGDALYKPESGNPILGKLDISTGSFTFFRPADRQGWPFLSGQLPAADGAIMVRDGCVILKCEKCSCLFELFPSYSKGLQEWVHKKAKHSKLFLNLTPAS